MHKGGVLEANFSTQVQWHRCVGSKQIRGEPELSSCQADRAMSQAKQDVERIFKLSIVACSVSFSVIALTVGDRASKKRMC